MDKITSICVGLKYIIGLFYAFYLHPISTNPQYLWPAKLAVYSCGVKRKNERTRAEYSYTNTGQMEVDVLQDEAARFFSLSHWLQLDLETRYFKDTDLRSKELCDWMTTSCLFLPSNQTWQLKITHLVR